MSQLTLPGGGGNRVNSRLRLRVALPAVGRIVRRSQKNHENLPDRSDHLPVLFTAGTLALLAWQFHHTRQLTADNAHLSQELVQSREAVTTLTDEKASISETLVSLQAMETELRERVDSLEAEAKTAADTTPRPYRVRAFVGQANVGQAWIVPHNVTRDPESCRYLFEPVLVIDESAKKHFTEHHTNVVEREVYTTEIYENYNRYPYYYGIAGRPGGSNRPPNRPQPPSKPGISTGTYAQQPSSRAQLSRRGATKRLRAKKRKMPVIRPPITATTAIRRG